MRRRTALPLFVGAALVGVALGCGADGSRRASTPPPSPHPADGPAVITLNPAVTYQTMNGWEGGIAEIREFVENLRLMRPAFLQEVGDLGINRLRVEVRSGLEHTQDTWREWQSRKLGKNDPWWFKVAAETVNDNDDPFSINWSGFHFADLDFDIDEVVNPLRAELERRGERLWTNFTYVAFTQYNGWFTEYVHEDPEEYAEFVLATYLHMQQKYGWVPDSWEVILEPDNTFVLRGSRSFLKNWSYWRGHDIGRAVAAAGSRLKAAGFSPRFVIPSTLNMAKAARYFDEAISVPGARQYVSALAYHRYSDPSDAALAAIAERAERYGIDSGMLEHLNAGYEELHKDLTLGRNSAWAQYRLATLTTRDGGGVYYRIDAADPKQPRLVITKQGRFFRQYFKFIRAGATRIDATSANRRFSPVAFVHPDGRTVVVVKADAGGSFAVHRVPPGLYGITYTTDSEYDVALPDARVTTDGTIHTAIPARGVLTIYRRRS